MIHERLCNVSSDLSEFRRLGVAQNHNQVRASVANTHFQFRMVHECRAPYSKISKPSITTLINFLLEFV